MKATKITELVNFKVLETTADEQLMEKAELLIDFQKKQDGFLDAELVKNVDGNSWCFIYHYESLDKVRAIGEKLRSSEAFDEFLSAIVPGSISITFHQPVRNWKLPAFIRNSRIKFLKS